MENTIVKERLLSFEKEPVSLTAFKEGKATYSILTKKLTMSVNESPGKYCWRLAYSLKYKFAHLIESSGITSTIWGLVCGTEKECRDKAKNIDIEIQGVNNEN